MSIYKISVIKEFFLRKPGGIKGKNETLTIS